MKVEKCTQFIKEQADAKTPAASTSTIELSLQEIEDLFYAAHIAHKNKKNKPVLKTIESEEGAKVEIVLSK